MFAKYEKETATYVCYKTTKSDDKPFVIVYVPIDELEEKYGSESIPKAVVVDVKI